MHLNNAWKMDINFVRQNNWTTKVVELFGSIVLVELDYPLKSHLLKACFPAGGATGVVVTFGGRTYLEKLGHWGCAHKKYIKTLDHFSPLSLSPSLPPTLLISFSLSFFSLSLSLSLSPSRPL
jgi:hypothetical protein